MDKKQRLIKLYEAEIKKISEIREDIQELSKMEDEQLIVLVEKAGRADQVQKKAWEQICGNDIDKKDVREILVNREEMNKDIDYMKELEKEVGIISKEIKEQKEICRQYQKDLKEKNISIRNKWILTISFFIMLVCAICFQFVMLKQYHAIAIPSFLLMIGIPLAGCVVFGYSLKQDFAKEEEALEEEQIQEEINLGMEKIAENEEILQYYEEKYQSIFGEEEDYMWDAYPYVEKILEKLDYREDYQKVKNEYLGIMEILHFKHPEEYLYFPEIFLVEEEQDEFIRILKERMKKMDEYLVQTIETA